MLIQEKNWLASSSINSWMALLRRERPDIGALYNVQHVQRLEVQATSSESWIQIFNVSNSHWVMVAKGFGPTPQQIMYYDSSPATDKMVTDHVKSGIAQLVQCGEQSFQVHIMPCQAQPDGYNCGPFALAFATALVFGMSPSTVRFDVPRMRHHMRQCLIAKKATPFPTVDVKISATRWRSSKTIAVNVYCNCRMPYDPSCENVKFRKMIQCENKFCVIKWFHIGCLPEDSVPSNPERDVFLCDKCRC